MSIYIFLFPTVLYINIFLSILFCQKIWRFRYLIQGAVGACQYAAPRRRDGGLGQQSAALVRLSKAKRMLGSVFWVLWGGKMGRNIGIFNYIYGYIWLYIWIFRYMVIHIFIYIYDYKIYIYMHKLLKMGYI
jgi:hypothetical protein